MKLVSSLSYTDIRDGLPKVIQHDHIISPVRNVDAYLTHFNKSVIEQAILYTANENLEKAMAEMDRGDFASANGYIDANRRYLASNVKYVQLSKDLRKMDSTNNGYGQDISRVRRMGGDSLKRVQKKSREMNYFLRQKKQ